jgi:leucyl aminopeptidase
MKVTAGILVSALLIPANARFIEPNEGNTLGLYTDWAKSDADIDPSSQNKAEKFLIELSPGETRWVTEDEKWELRRVINSP